MKHIQFIFALLITFFSISCTKSGNEDYEALEQKMFNSNPSGSGSGSNTPSYCTDSYNGPSGDIQIDAFCQSAWAHLCIDGYPATDPSVTGNCDIYNSMNESTITCPYCQ